MKLSNPIWTAHNIKAQTPLNDMLCLPGLDNETMSLAFYTFKTKSQNQAFSYTNEVKQTHLNSAQYKAQTLKKKVSNQRTNYSDRVGCHMVYLLLLAISPYVTNLEDLSRVLLGKKSKKI